MQEIVKPLRPYQTQVLQQTFGEWQSGARTVLVVMPTGAGKTRVLVEVVRLYLQAGYKIIVQVHRGELVYQISQALAEQLIHHTFIASDKDAMHCGNLHVQAFGRSFVDNMAKVAVASVPTMNSRQKRAPTQFSFDIAGTGLVIPDEAHHTLKNNTFGILHPLLPDARWMGVTATPRRADGQGLGTIAANGIFERMVMGPRMRDLIRMGNLCDYEIYEPPVAGINEIDWDDKDLQATAGGDINAKKQAARLDKPSITGDLVQHYLDLKPGRLMVTFCCDINHAQNITNAYRARGVPSEFLHGGNNFSERQATLTRYRNRETLVLNTVDLVSEGFDLPAIEGMAYYRRTLSLPWYLQTVGRVLRPSPGKDKAFILDHIGNCRHHGLPDKNHHWQLGDYKVKREDEEGYEDEIPLTRCRWSNCLKMYTINHQVCPHCGRKQLVETAGSKPALLEVAGKLRKMTPEEMAILRGEETEIDDQHVIYRNEASADLMKLDISPEQYVIESNMTGHRGAETLRGNHALWQIHQKNLRTALYWWLGFHAVAGWPKHAAQAMFKRRFGIDVYSAQTLRPKEAHELTVRISDCNVRFQQEGLPYEK